MLSNLSRRLGLFLFGSSILLSLSANAGISLVVTAPPPLREVIVEPAGYTRCYIVPQGFYRGIWHYRHRVCEYAEDDDLRVWISGYWQCVNYLPNGRCMRTAWVGNHWAVSVDREYVQAYQRYPGNYHRRQDSFRGAGIAVEVPGGPIAVQRARRHGAVMPPVIHRQNSRAERYERPPVQVEERRHVELRAESQHGHR